MRVKDFFKNVESIVVKEKRYPESLFDYALPSTKNKDVEINTIYFDVVSVVSFGTSEGIYLDLYIQGEYNSDCADGRIHLATYKTLYETDIAYITTGVYGCEFCLAARKFLNEHWAEIQNK